MILGIDPGREKIGLAIIDGEALLWRKIVAPAELEAELARLLREFAIQKIALGNSTASQKVRAQIEMVAPQIPLQIVDEKNSTLEARALYFEFCPPKGWKKWIPLSLQIPSEPIDDFAAAIIARRAFGEE